MQVVLVGQLPSVVLLSDEDRPMLEASVSALASERLFQISLDLPQTMSKSDMPKGSLLARPSAGASDCFCIVVL